MLHSLVPHLVSYVALECAGFITGLKQGEVVVLVRSMLLRGFDRDVVERVEAAMTGGLPYGPHMVLSGPDCWVVRPLS